MMDFFGFGKNQDKSKNKSNNTSILPPINTSRQLTYSNNRQIGNVQRQSSSKKKKDQQISLQSSPMSNLSSSVSSSSLSSIDSQENSYKTSESPVLKKVAKQQKNDLKIQSQEHEEYKDKTVSQIAQEIKQMRNKFVEMNKKLSQMLDLYTMAKTQFVPKQLMAPSKQQFYKVQIETNKKVEQAQISQLKKLNETQFGVKNKDIFFDLEKVLIEMRDSFHHTKMQLNEFKTKNHKQEIILSEINKVNNDNKENNAVKLLNLQIFYYMKKQNSLKIHQEQLQHEEKLILQNDKHLNRKVEELKKSNKNYYLFDENYQKMKEKYQSLKEKKQSLKKQIDIQKKAQDINEQKYARQLIYMNNQYRNIIKPKMIKCDQENKELQEKISSLMLNQQLNDKKLKKLSEKFSHQLIGKKSLSTKKLSRSILKPNLRPGSNLSNDEYLSARANVLSSSQSNEKVHLSHRYNDKNQSMTIDVNLQNDPRLRSFSEAISDSDFKPRNFRLMTKKDKRKELGLQKTQPYSMTIDHSYATNFMTSVEGNIAIQRPKMLKPKLLVGGTKR